MSPRALAAAAATLSEDYARGRASHVDDAVVHAAYLATRLPATYAAVRATLAMIPPSLLDAVHSVLDLGAGPGTATWAAHAACPRLTSAIQIDRSRAFLDLGRRLGTSAGLDDRLAVTRHVDDIGGPATWPVADLVVVAYALAELAPADREAVLASAWAAARQVLVIVEPGTPAAFARVDEARARALTARHAIVAPCSHDGVCPMRATGDWCHFAVRVPRTRRHRQLKGGSLGYEDEKYSCLVVAKPSVRPERGARVLRHPRSDPGRVGLVLCTPGVPTLLKVTRRDPGYRAARKVEWGGVWDREGRADAGPRDTGGEG